MTARSIVRWFARAYASLGLERCSSHSGRCTFITRSAKLITPAGGSLHDIQQLVGHSDLSTTQRYIDGRRDYMAHMSTRQYARLVHEWVVGIGLPAQDYGTHSLRRTRASIIYKAAGNLRAVQILLGHAKIDNTMRYLGVDIEDALELLERIEV